MRTIFILNQTNMWSICFIDTIIWLTVYS